MKTIIQTADGIIFEDAESWIKDNLRNLATDSICSIYFNKIDLDNFSIMVDSNGNEDDREKVISLNDMVEGLRLLATQIGKTWTDATGQKRGLFVGGLTKPHQLVDPCNWDAEVVDAFFQLIFYRDVIYG